MSLLEMKCTPYSGGGLHHIDMHPFYTKYFRGVLYVFHYESLPYETLHYAIFL
jgi:hypothetical protein